MTNRDFKSGNWVVFSILTASALLLGILLGKLRSGEYRPDRSWNSHAVETSAAIAETNKIAGPTLARKDGLKLLEDELSQALKRFAPQGPPETSLAARVPPPVVRQRKVTKPNKPGDAKEELMYLTPEDLAKAPTLEEAFGIPEFDKEGREKRQLTTEERFFERLNSEATVKNPNQKRTGFFGIEQEDEPSKRNSPQDFVESDLPPAIRDSEMALLRTLNAEMPFDQSFKPGNSLFEEKPSDFFGLGQQGAFSAPELSNPYLEQYRKMIQPPSIIGGTAAGERPSPLNSALPGPATGADPFPSTTLAPRAAEPTQLGAIRPFSSAPVVADPSQRALHGWDPHYTPPLQEQKRFEMPKPNFQAPKRKF